MITIKSAVLEFYPMKAVTPTTISQQSEMWVFGVINTSVANRITVEFKLMLLTIFIVTFNFLCLYESQLTIRDLCIKQFHCDQS